MTYQQIISVEVFCDFPGCDEYLLFAWEEAGEKTQIMMRAIGWTSISFPGEKKHEEEFLHFCAECKEKDPRLIKQHKCVYMRKTKKGKPSEYGTVLECYYCGRLKGQKYKSVSDRYPRISVGGGSSKLSIAERLDLLEEKKEILKKT